MSRWRRNTERADTERADTRRADTRRADKGPRDEGTALILALVVVIVGTLMVLPLMEYTLTVTRSNRVGSAKADRAEAVKGGLHAALYDPSELYSACSASGRTFAVALAAPPGLGIRTECTTVKESLQTATTDQRYALTTVQVGSEAQIPPPYVSVDSSSPELDGTVSPAWCTSMAATPGTPCGRPFPGNGAADPTAWLASTTTTSAGSMVFRPYLPPFSNTLAYAGGYAMPPGDLGEQCTVYFPGKYTDDVVITGTTPVYFVSGVYYFERTLRFSGDANVVAGAGGEQGCVDSDAIAVADAIGAPFDAYSNGVGATFVFGAGGRMMVDTATPGTGSGIHVAFNRRLVAAQDPLAILNNVSITSVTGVWTGAETVDLSVDLNLDTTIDLHVPETLVFGTTPPSDAWDHFYKASTLVSPASAAAPCAAPPTVPAVGCPIIDINLWTGDSVEVKIPGYISVPQGAVRVSVAPGAAPGKRIVLSGGILAAQVSVTPDVPEFIQLGLLNSVVQRTFKIVTETTSGTPHMAATALVQVNETGGYAVNSYVVQLD